MASMKVQAMPELYGTLDESALIAVGKTSDRCAMLTLIEKGVCSFQETAYLPTYLPTYDL